MHGNQAKQVEVQTSFAFSKEKYRTVEGVTQPFTTAIIDPDWPYTVGPKDTRYGYTRYEDGSRNVYKADNPLTIEELADLPIGDVVGGYLFMWMVGPFWIHPDPMKRAMPLLDAWGFEAASIITWAKWNREKDHGYGGVGFWFLGNAEWCVVAKRKGWPSIRTGHSSLLVAPKGRHSAKPEAVHELIEECFPGPFLEIFGRRARDGWTVLGNEAPGDGEDVRKSLQGLIR
jgi:N6-adenosine-specific RNA methylase IME4